VNVVVFGASGGVGVEAVRRALAGGHRVRAFVRDPERLSLTDARLDVFRGDVLDRQAVDAAAQGQDAALVVIGCRQKTDSESLVSEGIANIVPALEAAGVERLVFLSIMGVGPSRSNLGVMRHVLPRMLKDAYVHRELAEDTIRRSRLDWVIVRAVRLVDGPATGRYRAGEDVRVGMMAKVSRADVAELMVRQLTDNSQLHRSPSIAA
jgi:uncharacterized protein YbjT (DUF2867 family)